MSDLSQSSGLTPHESTEGHAGLFVAGVFYPATVIAIEMLTHFCASTFFDPIPTWRHAALLAFVPLANFMVWLAVHRRRTTRPRWLAFISGASIAIAAFYALVFLPLLPIALIAIVVGIGFLPLAPLVTAVSAMMLHTHLQGLARGARLTPALVGGLAAGFAILLVSDIPSAVTRLGVEMASSDMPDERDRGLMLLRTIGDEATLLQLCYGSVGRPAGLLSAAYVVYNNEGIFGARTPQDPQLWQQKSQQAREIYYRVYGMPFNARPAPIEPGMAARFADFRFDDDHGGTQVGGRLSGLTMIASRLDGSISGNDAVGYVEWTVEFRNDSALDRETRLQVALPPGGVVSRATLWINGEEREAAFGGRNVVRAAYQRVAVQQRRDPLLVTTKGGDRVMAQAFPVMRNGGTIKFRLGITAPLTVTEAGKAEMALPALVDRNFSFGPDLTHSVWLEGREPMATTTSGLTATRVDARTFRIVGALDDRTLTSQRPIIAVERNPAIMRTVARIGEGEPVVQEIAPTTASNNPSLMLVIDGSGRMASLRSDVIRALNTIPETAKVGAVVASETARQVKPAPFTTDQKERIVDLLRSTSFRGGQDNAPALADALAMLESEPGATLLWLHGPQPISFRSGAARLEQAMTRPTRLPDVVLYNAEPGPNEVLPDAPWAWAAQSLPRTDSVKRDLTTFFARATGQTPLFTAHRRVEITDTSSKGSDHIARLWANDRVREMMRASPNANRATATALAAQYQLITPVSGAVVLETRQQYDESRLTPVSQATVPTVPEPHEWALMFIALAALIWLAMQKRRQHFTMVPS